MFCYLLFCVFNFLFITNVICVCTLVLITIHLLIFPVGQFIVHYVENQSIIHFHDLFLCSIFVNYYCYVPIQFVLPPHISVTFCYIPTQFCVSFCYILIQFWLILLLYIYTNRKNTEWVYVLLLKSLLRYIENT